MTKTDSVEASIILGALLLVLIAWSLYNQLLHHWVKRAYDRDVQRAALIAQHHLIQMPAKKKDGAA